MLHRLLSFAIFLVFAIPTFADDWPQWRGPQRDGVSKEKGLLQSWPKDGPPLLWTNESIGLGYSSPSIVGNKLFVLGAVEDTTYLFCLNVEDGKEIWKTKIGPIFTFDGNTWGDGPRSSPTVDGDLVYALGGHGDLVCARISSGELVWKLNYVKDLNGKMMTEWGFSESVLIDGQKLVCMPGGKDGTFAALDKKTGKVIWRSSGLKESATYASIMPATIEGVEQYVGLSYEGGGQGASAVGLNAKTGEVLWKILYNKGDSYSVAITPVIKGNLIYVEDGDGGSCHLLKVSKEGNAFTVKDTYKRSSQRSMKNGHGGVVLVDGNVYGYSDRYGWVSQDFKTGKLNWESIQGLPVNSTGSIIAADGQLYLYTDEGNVGLIEASPKGFDLKGKFSIPKKFDNSSRPTSQRAGVWTHPVIANGRLYLRDQNYLFCYDIRAKK